VTQYRVAVTALSPLVVGPLLDALQVLRCFGLFGELVQRVSNRYDPNWGVIRLSCHSPVQ